MDSTITSEEYIAKKQKLLNQKIDFSEKLKDFERKGNRWLEPPPRVPLALFGFQKPLANSLGNPCRVALRRSEFWRKR